jgi:hypothetical protein
MKCRIILNTFADTRTEEEKLQPFYVKGHHETVEVWRGDLDIIPENIYLMKFSLLGHGEPRPLADIPFSTGVGYWVWINPLDGSVYDEGDIRSGRNLDDNGPLPGLFRDLGEQALPRMAIADRERKSRRWLPFRDYWRRRSNGDSHSAG